MEEAANFIFVYFTLDQKEKAVENGCYEVITTRGAISAGFAGTCDPSRQKRIEINFDAMRGDNIYVVSIGLVSNSKDRTKEIENIFVACFKNENDAKLFLEDLKNKKKNPYLEKDEKMTDSSISRVQVIN
jgi:hypothetical protein